jgi:5'-nucleotidase
MMKEQGMRFDGRLRRSSRLVLAVLCGLLLTAGCSGASQGDDPAPSPRGVDGPLNILLVNDDGWDAAGITAVYDALREAGHHVTLVAPARNQSGASMSSSSTPLEVTQPEPGSPKYSVAGTPVDAVNVGLFGLLRGKKPDVVVSGPNHGANVGANVNYSGTVGAAVAASEAGIPAFAVSADVDAAGVADFTTAATVTVRLVEKFARADFQGVGRRALINVNVPFRTAELDKPRGVVVVDAAAGGPRKVVYRNTGDGFWAPEFAYDPRVGPSSDDAERLASGYVTVTALSTARQTLPSSQGGVRDLVRSADLLDD